MIDMGLYRRFYRQKRRSFAGAGDGAICGASTFSTSLSITWHLSAERHLIATELFLAHGVIPPHLKLTTAEEQA